VLGRPLLRTAAPGTQIAIWVPNISCGGHVFAAFGEEDPFLVEGLMDTAVAEIFFPERSDPIQIPRYKIKALFRGGCRAEGAPTSCGASWDVMYDGQGFATGQDDAESRSLGTERGY